MLNAKSSSLLIMASFSFTTASAKGFFASYHPLTPPPRRQVSGNNSRNPTLWNSLDSHQPGNIPQDLGLSANYLSSQFHKDDGTAQIRHQEILKRVKRLMSHDPCHPLKSMAVIDALQRFGIDYHFREEIGLILNSLYSDYADFSGGSTGGLYDAALLFRLLRQHGYHASTDVFDRFIDGKGRFKMSMSEDVRGMLSLYEASHLSFGEDVLGEAYEFSGKRLKALIGKLEPDLSVHVKHTLEHPYHTSLQRHKVRHYLSHSQGTIGRDNTLHELAVLDFNLVQSMHQRELLTVFSWWGDLGLAQELNFIRDQPVKWYMWSMAVLSDPQFSTYRIELTKSIALIYVVDDIFDVCGSLDELILFTEAINKWDVSATESLPTYMKACYMCLYNNTNEIAQMVLKEHGWDPISSLKKTWVELCNAFLQEAKWFASGHVPKADEYLRNGMISSGVHVVLIHLFFLLGQGITKESIDQVERKPAIISSPAVILRLTDDLGSAKDEKQEGFDGSYVDCYMKEHGSCSESAREHVDNMISLSWKNLNKECLSSSSFCSPFVLSSLNFARMVNVMYNYDGNQRLPMLEELINLLLLKSI